MMINYLIVVFFHVATKDDDELNMSSSFSFSYTNDNELIHHCLHFLFTIKHDNKFPHHCLHFFVAKNNNKLNVLSYSFL
jgi:hypothetical protein